MKVHLRLTEKDVDLCRWRHSIKHGMMTYYVGQILLAEAQGKIACLPSVSAYSEKKDPCDVYMVFTDSDIISLLLTFPVSRRNATLKKIIRKHLRLQSEQGNENVVYPTKTQSKEKTVKNQPAPYKKVTAEEKPVSTKRVITETEEERAAILALIAMSGE